MGWDGGRCLCLHKAGKSWRCRTWVFIGICFVDTTVQHGAAVRAISPCKTSTPNTCVEHLSWIQHRATTNVEQYDTALSLKHGRCDDEHIVYGTLYSSQN